MLKRAEKEAIISGIKTDIENAKAIFLTNVIGLTSNDGVALRKEVRDSDGKIVVARNTLFRKSSEGTSAEEMLSGLKGPHALAFAFEDAAAVAKSLKEAGEDHKEIVELKGGILDGKVLSLAEVLQLASLPSKDQMLATLLATFNAPISALARVLNSVREQKEEGAPVEAVEAAPAE